MKESNLANELHDEDRTALLGVARRRRADVIDVLSDGLLTMRLRVPKSTTGTSPLRLVKESRDA